MTYQSHSDFPHVTNSMLITTFCRLLDAEYRTTLAGDRHRLGEIEAFGPTRRELLALVS